MLPLEEASADMKEEVSSAQAVTVTPWSKRLRTLTALVIVFDKETHEAAMTMRDLMEEKLKRRVTLQHFDPQLVWVGKSVETVIVMAQNVDRKVAEGRFMDLGQSEWIQLFSVFFCVFLMLLEFRVMERKTLPCEETFAWCWKETPWKVSYFCPRCDKDSFEFVSSMMAFDLCYDVLRERPSPPSLLFRRWIGFTAPKLADPILHGLPLLDGEVTLIASIRNESSARRLHSAISECGVRCATYFFKVDGTSELDRLGGRSGDAMLLEKVLNSAKCVIFVVAVKAGGRAVFYDFEQDGILAQIARYQTTPCWVVSR